jgi:hypothetical protein
MHVQDPEIVKKNDPGFMDIKVGTVIDDITKPIAKLQKITSTDSNGVVTNVSHLHFEIRDGKIIDNFLQDKKSAPLNAVVNNLSANGYFPYKTDSVTKKNTVQDLITDGYCEPSYVIQQNHGQTVTLESPSKTTTIADGTYPIYVTNASIDNGTCYLKFKTTTKYYIIVDYLLKVWVQGKSPEYDMNKYYESNYPVTEYKNGKVNSIPIQNLPKIIGKSKSELLAILANYPAPDDDYNFYSLVNDSELQYKISDNCDISLSGSLSTHAGRLEKISSQELVNRINKYLNKSSNNKYIYDISIEIKSGEMVTFSEAYRS